ncbi:MAG: hypothetical protein ABW184_14955 [Sphingobium sp.]
MRLPRTLLLLPLGLVAACNSDPGFDERFNEKDASIRATSNGIEQEVTQQLSGAPEAEHEAAAAQDPATTGNGGELP